MNDPIPVGADYSGLHGNIVALLETARQSAARAINALMTATYWEIGHASSNSNNAGGTGPRMGKR
jgi:hypothetical protein